MNHKEMVGGGGVVVWIRVAQGKDESRDSSVSIATRYGLDDWGSNPGGGWEFFFSTLRPDRFWGPLSLLSNGYQGLFP
jgi:hypothetical protein